MARDDPQLKFRVPAKLREDLESAASANGRSLSAEIVQRLEQSFALRDPFAGLTVSDEWVPVPPGREIERQTAEVIMDPRVRLAMRIAMRSYGILAKLTPEVLNNDNAIMALERTIATNPDLLDGSDHPGTGHYADPTDAPQAASKDDEPIPIRPTSRIAERNRKDAEIAKNSETQDRKDAKPNIRFRPGSKEAEVAEAGKRIVQANQRPRYSIGDGMKGYWHEKAARRRTSSQTED